jgi:hypothetical protein
MQVHDIEDEWMDITFNSRIAGLHSRVKQATTQRAQASAMYTHINHMHCISNVSFRRHAIMTGRQEIVEMLQLAESHSALIDDQLIRCIFV